MTERRLIFSVGPLFQTVASLKGRPHSRSRPLPCVLFSISSLLCLRSVVTSAGLRITHSSSFLGLLARRGRTASFTVSIEEVIHRVRRLLTLNEAVELRLLFMKRFFDCLVSTQHSSSTRLWLPRTMLADLLFFFSSALLEYCSHRVNVMLLCASDRPQPYPQFRQRLDTIAVCGGCPAVCAGQNSSRACERGLLRPGRCLSRPSLLPARCL